MSLVQFVLTVLLTTVPALLTYFNGFVKDRSVNLSYQFLTIVKIAVKQDKIEHFQCTYTRYIE